MKARFIDDHFRSIGSWVNWENTEDEFLFGDPEVEVQGIAIAWIATNKLLQEAADAGHNLFIAHEPAYYPGYESSQSTQELIAKKEALLTKLGITLYRCHDTWDRMPEHGIVDSWASFLGFETLPRPTESFYRICLTDDLTVKEIAQKVAEKIGLLGQKSVLIFGDPDRKIQRMALGTGAITRLPNMHELGAELLLVSDDGMNYWTGGHWSVDQEIPLLVVNHAISELPGMQALASYLQKKFPATPVKYLPLNYRFTSITV